MSMPSKPIGPSLHDPEHAVVMLRLPPASPWNLAARQGSLGDVVLEDALSV